MTNFEELTALLEKNAPGAYMAAEMAENSYQEKYFRLGAGAHNTYSLSKSVTSCAVGILEREGKLYTAIFLTFSPPDTIRSGKQLRSQT